MLHRDGLLLSVPETQWAHKARTLLNVRPRRSSFSLRERAPSRTCRGLFHHKNSDHRLLPSPLAPPPFPKPPRPPPPPASIDIDGAARCRFEPPSRSSYIRDRFPSPRRPPTPPSPRAPLPDLEARSPTLIVLVCPTSARVLPALSRTAPSSPPSLLRSPPHPSPLHPPPGPSIPSPALACASSRLPLPPPFPFPRP